MLRTTWTALLFRWHVGETALRSALEERQYVEVDYSLESFGTEKTSILVREMHKFMVDKLNCCS